MTDDTYTLTETASGWAVQRPDGALAEFLERPEAEFACDKLLSGDLDESAYEWIDAE